MNLHIPSEAEAYVERIEVDLYPFQLKDSIGRLAVNKIRRKIAQFTAESISIGDLTWDVSEAEELLPFREDDTELTFNVSPEYYDEMLVRFETIDRFGDGLVGRIFVEEPVKGQIRRVQKLDSAAASRERTILGMCGVGFHTLASLLIVTEPIGSHLLGNLIPDEEEGEDGEKIKRRYSADANVVLDVATIRVSSDEVTLEDAHDRLVDALVRKAADREG